MAEQYDKESKTEEPTEKKIRIPLLDRQPGDPLLIIRCSAEAVPRILRGGVWQTASGEGRAFCRGNGLNCLFHQLLGAQFKLHQFEIAAALGTRQLQMFC